jgi:CDP-4-dehydro-6-deoxyglucose reductase, E1
MYNLIYSNWSKKEIKNIKDVIKSNRYTMGKKVDEFEKKFSKYIGSKYSVMVNSGSSANLLALNSFFFKKKNKLKRGDEIIVPAISWSTTYSPMQQLGLKLKIVDVDLDTININFEKLKKAITKKTKAICVVNILGLPCELEKIKKLCKQKKILLFEDNCESLGAEINGKKCGSFGDVSTHSFFYSHHICTMEGGMISTNNHETYCILRSLRAHGWTRDLNFKNPLTKHDLKKTYELYNFILPGYNVRPLEMSGALGLTQIKKIDNFIKIRRDNLKFFNSLFKDDERFILPSNKHFSSSFSFPIIFKDTSKKKQLKFYEVMKKNKIDFRLIAGGCFTKQEYSRYFDYKIYNNLNNSIKIHKDGFVVGNAPINLKNKISKLKKLFDKIK